MLERVMSMLAQAPQQQKPGWYMWPFHGYGLEGGVWPTVARYAFVAVIFAGICLFLRYLFGPGGPLRGEGWETIQQAREREAREKAETLAKPQPPTRSGNGTRP